MGLRRVYRVYRACVCFWGLTGPRVLQGLMGFTGLIGFSGFVKSEWVWWVDCVLLIFRIIG